MIKLFNPITNFMRGDDEAFFYVSKKGEPRYLKVDKNNIRQILIHFSTPSKNLCVCSFTRIKDAISGVALVLVEDTIEDGQLIGEFPSISIADKHIKTKLDKLEKHLNNFQIIFDGERPNEICS